MAEPNAKDGLMPDISELYIKDRTQFLLYAKEHTKKYAMNENTKSNHREVIEKNKELSKQEDDKSSQNDIQDNKEESNKRVFESEDEVSKEIKLNETEEKSADEQEESDCVWSDED